MPTQTMPSKVVLTAGVAGVAGVSICTVRCLAHKFARNRGVQPSLPTQVTLPEHAPSKRDQLRPDEGIWIYFGSQSGTAQQFSEDLKEQAGERGLKAKVVDLEEFDEDAFVQHRCVVLVVATYGEGDPTDNAKDFFTWLQSEERPDELFAGMNFTVMGLGNRQYDKFNEMGIIADARMEVLGANRIYELGAGDDENNIQEDWEQWKESGVWPALLEACGLDTLEPVVDQNASAEDVVSKLPLDLELCDNACTEDPLVVAGGADVVGKWYFNAYEAPIVQCDELRQHVDKSQGLTTKHIEFDVSALPLEWKTADNLEVLPANTEANVEWFAQRFGVQDRLESMVNFTSARVGGEVVRQPFPIPCTVRMALTLYCDLCSAPVKNVAKKFSAFITDASDKAALDKILEMREVYQLLTTGVTRISLREFFALFMPSAELEFGTFLQLCARQKNRAYTIASSARERPGQIGLCVGMVKEHLNSLESVMHQLDEQGHRPPRADAVLQALGEERSQRREFLGACSTMLCTRVSVGSKCWIFARSSGFRLPREVSTPIVMVGAGTGVAPFHAFLREFWAEGGVRPETFLFFGCWKPDEDFIYREELEQAVKHSPPVLTEVITAFSRQQAHKVYVQHRFRERAAEMKALADRGAHFYVCGSTSMGASIRKELAEALGNEDLVKRLHSDGRFYEELW